MKAFNMEGISSNAAKRIFMSTRPGLITGYKLAWKKCCRQLAGVVDSKLIQFGRALLSKILNYLSLMFEKCLQY